METWKVTFFPPSSFFSGKVIENKETSYLLLEKIPLFAFFFRMPGSTWGKVLPRSRSLTSSRKMVAARWKNLKEPGCTKADAPTEFADSVNDSFKNDINVILMNIQDGADCRCTRLPN